MVDIAQRNASTLISGANYQDITADSKFMVKLCSIIKVSLKKFTTFVQNKYLHTKIELTNYQHLGTSIFPHYL